MNGKWTLYVDQWGNKWSAHSVAELRRKIGGGTVSNMYRDGPDGCVKHVGYVVGQHWCTAFQPVENDAHQQT